ncbi:hypothetical protein BDA96_07G209300 [Sorghum bicolor]|uniref:Uncharacterized protein n=2 Tax=Sorghum bicolor TaxID=4558 RepID=A0A1Z5RBA5_SORBI|nr:uncharacterized protein LOC8060968 isoform X2 [Sorghum bicolor]KAG0524416.1 hypothetical protein BDA96_07G209300 [Sorghum bicolor]OQU80848.1 hypothetical protein SORBI_3007G196900 [Sorghum bicolor]OQU80849.1 hypothetical protein SORBI_3007G196900 [Sorghum bicolor]|eukprot:XP_021320798.1 uncharacterized protein LOC8060968 isoform X2 [Sorghum bicolor]
MSRCFPFPPPGFESRPRSEERRKDLLRKEKHKEKKHRKAKDRGKGEPKEKGRDYRKDKHNRKHKRAKRGERKKNKDIYKDRNQTLRHRKPKENGQQESLKDIIPADELVTQIFGQGDHTDLKYNYTELLPWSTDSIGCTGSKEKERNGRMIKKSEQGTEDNYGMVQKGDSIVHANKEGMGRGVDSKTEIKNGKSLQDRSAEMHSRRRYSCNGVGLCHDNSDTQRSSEGIHTATGRVAPNPNIFQRTEETGQYPNISVHSANMKNDKSSTESTGEENQGANNFRHKMDWQFARDKDGAVQGKEKGNYRRGLEGKDRDSVVKKRKTECKNKEKEAEKNGTVNEDKHEDLGALGASKDKVDNLVRLDCLNEQKFASDIRKMKDFYPNSSSHGQHECQHSYNNGITGSRYLEEQMPSISSSGYESNKGYLKQPHPDTKYLSQVHCIPSTLDFSEYIDQDWLFSVGHVKQTETLEAIESHQVWTDAQLIDTADVSAMPYVVPF